MATYQDAGILGVVQSLANVAGRYGFGVKVTSKSQSLAGATSYAVLQSNPKRIFALVVNTHATEAIYTVMGDVADATGIYSAPNGGGFQIDRYIPWTGSVSVYSAGASSCNVIEGELSG